MHIMRKEGIDISRAPSEYLDALRLITAKGTIETDEEAIVYVIDLRMFVTLQLFGDTPWEWKTKLCDENWYSFANLTATCPLWFLV